MQIFEVIGSPLGAIQHTQSKMVVWSSMQSKYELTELVKTWAVKMSASGRIMETFGTKAEASKAIKQYESGTRLAEAKPEVWVVGDFVAEARLGGMQLGEATQLEASYLGCKAR